MARQLFGGRFDPITFEWGFLEATPERVFEGFVLWHQAASKVRDSVKWQAVPISEKFENALQSVPPLGHGRNLVIETQSRWSAVFEGDPGMQGTTIGALTSLLGCRGVTVFNDPVIPGEIRDTERSQGGISWQLFADKPVSGPNHDLRWVGVIRNDRRFVFEAVGEQQPFERAERYAAKRVIDRFTVEMMEEYCNALGIRVFDETFYGPRGLIVARKYGWLHPRPRGESLEEARRRLGLGE